MDLQPLFVMITGDEEIRAQVIQKDFQLDSAGSNNSGDLQVLGPAHIQLRFRMGLACHKPATLSLASIPRSAPMLYSKNPRSHYP